MEKLYPYSTKQGKDIVVNIHIYVARTIFLQSKDDLMITKKLILSNWK